MNSSRGKWATVGAAAVALPLLAAFVASKDVNNVPLILLVGGVSVLLLCALDQLLFSSGGGQAFPRSLGVSVLRGGVAGLTSWLGMMLFVHVFVEVGDKFPLFAVFFLPFAIVFGAVASALATSIFHALRSPRI